MNESEKVSSPSAALPDVRKLVEMLRGPFSPLPCATPEMTEREYAIYDVASEAVARCLCAADALEAALRPAQPEEAAQRADFEAFKQRLLARSEHDGPGPYPHELDPEYEADLREAFEAGAASQRATPLRCCGTSCDPGRK